MKVIVKRRGAAQPYSFSFVDNEGKVVLKSESYKAKDSAVKGVKSIRKNCTEDKRYVLKESSSGMFFFNIKSANGQVVVTSAMFSSLQDRKDAINLVKIYAPGCALEEQLS